MTGKMTSSLFARAYMLFVKKIKENEENRETISVYERVEELRANYYEARPVYSLMIITFFLYIRVRIYTIGCCGGAI